MVVVKENFQYINMKRKRFSKTSSRKFKRFKRLPKYVKDNPENKVAKELRDQDPYHFTDSDDDPADELGMGIDISDLPALFEDDYATKQKDIITLTQDTVVPLYSNESSVDETKLDEALADLKYNSFRPNQLETIKRILMGRSTLFISPTGSGKSLCYQLPALLYWRQRKYMTIVVSPLIALMEDQMQNLPKCLSAVSIHSSQSYTQKRLSIQKLVDQKAQIVFISPEAIVAGLLDLEDLKNLPPVGFVCIDEAHCLSEWSHNFRPAYLQFCKILSEDLNIKTFLALTATATRSTIDQVSRSLSIDTSKDVIGSTSIPENLVLSVSCEVNLKKSLIDLLQTPSFNMMTSIIIYCNRREETEDIACHIRTRMQNYTTLVKQKVSSSRDECDAVTDAEVDVYKKLTWNAEAYHAGLSGETRKKIQRQFIRGDLRVVVATFAFGLGINKADVRSIIHIGLPRSFESYVQEIGRAGRDGKPAQCHVFLRADSQDIFFHQRHLYASITEPKNLDKLIEYLFPRCYNHCRCQVIATKEDKARIDELNENEESSGSVIKKHRVCNGHEVTFDIETATHDMNLYPESIITLVYRIQQAYPQLKIETYTPMKGMCSINFLKGLEQLNSLAKTHQEVRFAHLLHLRKNPDDKKTKKISFNVNEVASGCKVSTKDLMQKLAKLEWEIVEETGRFRKSQVRVKFSGNYFHFKAVGDLNHEERCELSRFLKQYSKSFESEEKMRVARLYKSLKSHCIDISDMNDKTKRLDKSSALKKTLSAYFDNSASASSNEKSDDIGQLSEISNFEKDLNKLTKAKKESVLNSAKEFVSAHGREGFTPRTIARIFQGVSTPNYPAEHWGPNKRWWRIHVDIDFDRLSNLIQDVLRERKEHVSP